MAATQRLASEVIAVTKPYRGEGVTLAVTSLAFATGVLDSRTVLVDANTRAGSVDELYMAADAALADAIDQHSQLRVAI